jgi:sec-independent protein translocase protein TatB
LHALLILESIGTPELLVILVVALILLGPRKLPEMARSLGRSLNEFKRASDDFKRTWEREVEVERVETRERMDHAMSGAPDPAAASADQSIAPPAVALPPRDGEPVARGGAQTDAQTDNVPAQTADADALAAAADGAAAGARKSDWL